MTPKITQQCRSVVFAVNFEHIQEINLVFYYWLLR